MSIAPSSSPETPFEDAPSQDGLDQDTALLESTAHHPEDATASVLAPNIDTALVSATLGRSKRRPNPALLRPLFSCGGALGLGLLLAHTLVKPAPDRVSSSTGEPGVESLPQIFLPRSSTLIVTAQAPPGALMRGHFQLATDLAGTAPVAGAVARQLVEVGARVQRGDAVLEISSGQAERPAPRVESLQNQAEKQQIDASNSQTALAQKVAGAQAQLLGAQERVTRAQAQIAQARDIVRRLQNGQPVAATEIPASLRDAPAPLVTAATENADSPRPNRKTARRRRRRRPRSPVLAPSPAAPVAATGPSRATAIALQQAQAAAEAAKSGARDAQNARQMLTLAQRNAREADDRAQTAVAAVSEVEARFEGKKATGADVEAARSAQRDAAALAAVAAKNVANAQAELGQREKAAASLQQYAEKAQTEFVTLSASDSKNNSRVAAAAQATPAAEPISEAAAPAPQTEVTAAPQNAPKNENAPKNDGRLTLEAAARFAGAALDESRRASRDAERIHAAIETYQNQVTASRSRIESATQNLASAQQKVLDVVPRPRFTSARARADGIVTWISRLAREVGAGQNVFGLASGSKIGVQFEDKSGLWRGLKPGAILPALLETAPSASSTPAPGKTPSDATPAATMVSSTTPNSAGSVMQGSAAQVKIASVTAPVSPGEAAIVSGEFSGPVDQVGGAMKSLTVVASVPQPRARPTLSVPVSAILREGDQAYLAILSATPLSVVASTETASTATATATATASAPSPTVPEGGKDGSGDFVLRWQPVEVGRSDGLRQEIKVGLSAGARVVLRPLELAALGVSTPNQEPLSAGMDASSEVDNAAALAPEAELNAAEIVVHLTDSPA